MVYAEHVLGSVSYASVFSGLALGVCHILPKLDTAACMAFACLYAQSSINHFSVKV